MANQVISTQLVGTDSIYLALDKLKGEVSKTGIKVVSDVAADARKIAYANFFNKSKNSGGLLYNSMYWRRKMGKPPLMKAKGSGYYDSTGRRLVNFSLKAKGPYTKSAYLSSYPMNLWERNSKDGRKGLWIMTVKLAPMVMAGLGKTVAEAEKSLSVKGQALIDGGSI